MKKIMPILFLLMFAFAINAQTVKTDDGKRFVEVEKQIKVVEAEIQETSLNLEKLRTEYAEKSIEVKRVKDQLNELNKNLTSLNSEKKSLERKQLVKTLPNNQVELLKIIAIQNERIIELLEKLTDKPQ